MGMRFQISFVAALTMEVMSACGLSSTPNTPLPPSTPTLLSPTPSNSPAPTKVSTETPTTILAHPPSASAPGETWTRPNDGMTVIYVPEGRFEMGSEEEDPCSHLDEYPLHTVYLDAFWIDQTEVTNTQYSRCVEVGACASPPTCDRGELTYEEPSKGNYPVACVSWDEAQNYCAWVGGRLPTEAEWEKAAGGTDGRKYPWGNEFDLNKCYSLEAEIEGPVPVGNYSPIGDGPYGLVDMSGNVWEWVQDWYDIGYYPRASSTNPGGPGGGDNRSVRGGSWYGDKCSTCVSYRYYNSPRSRSPGVGFRCAVSIE